MDQQLQIVQSNFSQLEVNSSCIHFKDFLSSEEFSDVQLINFLRQEWEKLYDSRVLKSPLYKSEVIETISLHVLKSWIGLEKYFAKLSNQNLSSATNILITGAKGVGKTTLMIGLHAIINKYCINVASLYIDYEMGFSDLRCSKYFSHLDSNENFDFVTLERYAERINKGFIFFGDEIQTLYLDKSYLSTVQNILAIGKAATAMGIISGSSSNVRALAFKEVEDEKYNLYPNLNSTVYKAKYLNPLRTEIEIQQYLQSPKKTIHIDPLHLFQMTGGVGRYMYRFLFLNDSDIDCLKIQEKMESDSLFCSVAWVIYNKYLRMKNVSSPITWIQPKISKTEIKNLGAFQCINRWIDENILFACTSTAYEFLIPSYLTCVEEYFTEKPNYLRLIAFQSTIGGWKGYDSAGKVLESYIIEKYINDGIQPFQGKKFGNEHISAAETISKKITRGVKILCLKDTELEYLHNRVISFTQDNGIYAIILEFNENDSAIEITVIQIKTGVLNSYITMGTDKSTDANKYFLAIITKADKGCKQMLKLFQERYEGTDFRLKAFVLLTSKNVSKDVQNLKQVSICETEIPYICLHNHQFEEVFRQELNEFYSLNK